MNLPKRIEMTGQSILENEALREDLDDAAAKILFDWLLPQAETIARSTADIEDEEDADEAMYPRLKALRKLMLRTGKWIAKGADQSSDDHTGMLEKIIKYAETMYGDVFIAPDQTQQDAFLQKVSSLLESPESFIRELQTLLEAQGGE